MKRCMCLIPINNNNNIGLLLQSDAVNNTVQKNTFLGNAVYDIFNAGTGNAFIKNSMTFIIKF